MNDHPSIVVAFAIEQRGDDLFFFRATHKPDAVWHGPYRDLDELTATIAHYVKEEAIEAWLMERQVS